MNQVLAQPSFSLEGLEMETALRAAATDLQGTVVNEDFMAIIGDYQREYGIFWDLIFPQNKVYAKSDIVKEMLHNRYPKVGGVDRNTLDSVAAGVRNTQQDLARDFSDPGQQIKATYGDVDASYYERSLQAQQGYIYENTFSVNTDNMLKAAIRYRDQKLFTGDATTNPTEYNGLISLMAADSRQSYLDMTDPNVPEPEIYKAMIDLAIGVGGEPNENHQISHIFCSPSGDNRLIQQVADLNIYENQITINPGIVVQGIRVSGSTNGMTPIIDSRYIPDEYAVVDPDPDGTGQTVDLIHYYMVDMSTIQWHGVVPYGYSSINNPATDLDYKVFDLVGNTIGNASLLQRRFLLQFGCLYALNRGRGIHRLTLKVPPGTAYRYRTTAIQP